MLLRKDADDEDDDEIIDLTCRKPVPPPKPPRQIPPRSRLPKIETENGEKVQGVCVSVSSGGNGERKSIRKLRTKVKGVEGLRVVTVREGRVHRLGRGNGTDEVIKRKWPIVDDQFSLDNFIKSSLCLLLYR